MTTKKEPPHKRLAGYYYEDTDCVLCIYSQGRIRGCSMPYCCCGEEERNDTIPKRIKRKPGAMKWDS